MKRPNINRIEFEEYLYSIPESLKASLELLVESGRITEKEAENHLGLYSKIPQVPVILLGIRGYYKNTMGKPGENDRGIYDDAMALSAPGVLLTFNANTDPSRIQKNIGVILPGSYEYKKGLHGISRGNPYQAFRPATAGEWIPGLRDGLNGIQKIVTPNIHSGGEFNVNSAACQTIIKHQWAEFKTKSYALLDAHKQIKLPYVLLENLE